MIYNTAQLVALLDELKSRIERGDCLKGNLMYSCMEEGLQPGEWDVSGSYRSEDFKGQPAVHIIPRPRNRVT